MKSTEQFLFENQYIIEWVKNNNIIMGQQSLECFGIRGISIEELLISARYGLSFEEIERLGKFEPTNGIYAILKKYNFDYNGDLFEAMEKELDIKLYDNYKFLEGIHNKYGLMVRNNKFNNFKDEKNLEDFLIYYKDYAFNICNDELFLDNFRKKYQYNARYGYVYIIESQGLYKIGYTKKLKDRTNKYVTENPNEITFILGLKSENYKELEKELHTKFKEKRVRGEWFSLTQEDIENIKSEYKNYLITK